MLGERKLWFTVSKIAGRPHRCRPSHTISPESLALLRQVCEPEVKLLSATVGQELAVTVSSALEELRMMCHFFNQTEPRVEEEKLSEEVMVSSVVGNGEMPLGYGLDTHTQAQSRTETDRPTLTERERERQRPRGSERNWFGRDDLRTSAPGRKPSPHDKMFCRPLLPEAKHDG